MIPKTIHYCWLSGDEMPDDFRRYIAGWRRLMPDYKFRLWDMDSMKDCDSEYFREAAAAGKYAFASDYVRLYALYNYGGIYLDCDVEVLRTFNPLLHLPYFICREDTKHGIEAAVIGAEKGCRWIKDCLDYYEKLLPSKDEVMPSVIKKALSIHNYKISQTATLDNFDLEKRTICILPSAFFSPKSYVTNKINVTPQTYCIHHFSGSWQPKWKKLLLKLWVPFSYKFPHIAGLLLR